MDALFRLQYEPSEREILEREIKFCTSEVNGNHETKFKSTGDIVKKAIQLFLDKPINKELTFQNLDVHM